MTVVDEDDEVGVDCGKAGGGKGGGIEIDVGIGG